MADIDDELREIEVQEEIGRLMDRWARIDEIKVVRMKQNIYDRPLPQ